MQLTDNKFIAIIIITTVISYFYCIIINFISKNFGIIDKSFKKSQTAHLKSTSRLGGLGILLSIITIEIIFSGIFRIWFFISLIPIFTIGLIEDLHIDTKPYLRLLVGVISSLLAIYLSQYWLKSVDFPLVDKILSISFFGIAFTVFASVGMINAINLIDGIHGFAAAKVVLISIGIFLISSKVGENRIAVMAALLAASSLGLFFISFPNGKLFLGDAGAYSLGFLIGWQIIILLSRNPELSAWSLLALVFWPVMDTLFSIFRRMMKGKSTNKPDLLHFHQLIMRFLEIISRKKISRVKSNPLSTAIIIPFSIIPIIFGIKYSHDNTAGIKIVIISTLIYIMSYYGIINLIKYKKYRDIMVKLTYKFWSKI